MWRGAKCYKCNSEFASKACYCNKELKFIGSNCLMIHLRDPSISHFLIDLTLSSNFLISQKLPIPSTIITSISSKSLLSFASDSFSDSNSLLSIHFLSGLQNLNQSKSSSSSHIYFTKPQSNTIYSYDIPLQKLTSSTISGLIHPFMHSITRPLPGSFLLICDFLEFTDSIILCNLTSKRLPNLPKFSIAIEPLSLTISSHYLYLFGFKYQQPQLVISQRYDLNKNTWKVLPEMKHNSLSLFLSAENEIYGFRALSNIVDIVNNVNLGRREVNIDDCDANFLGRTVGRVGDRIYLYSRNYVQVYDDKLRKLYQIKNKRGRDRYYHDIPVSYNESLYLYDYQLQNVIRLDTKALSYSDNSRGLGHYEKNVNRYYYKTRDFNQIIYRFDLKRKTISQIDMNGRLGDDFNLSSLCLLPNGKVFIAGFYNGACYMMNPADYTLARLPNLSKPRIGMSLLYHDGCVYAIGGYVISDVEFLEKYEIGGSEWARLEDMIEARRAPGCDRIGDKIFIICGGPLSMEIYDVLKNSYTLSQISFINPSAVAIAIEDRLFVIDKDTYKILNEEGDVLEEGKQDLCSESIATYNNILKYEGSIYLYNNSQNRMEFLNLSNLKRGVEYFHEF